MSKWYFVPDSWELSESLRKWAKDKGLTDSMIEDQLDEFRDHQYKKPMMRADACFRNWIRNGLKWGNIVPVVQYESRGGIQELTAEEKQADIKKFQDDMKRFKVVK